MTNAMTQASYVRELTMFALRRKGKCFVGWTPQIVFRFIAFHLLAGTLFIAREGRALLGVGVAFPCHAAWAVEHGKEPFKWVLPEQGNTLFISDVVVSTRRAVPMLWKQALNKWPWISHVSMMHRGRMIELHLRQMEQLTGGCYGR